eukprot:6185320-Pleurochrysis_carterae.AAC.3
MANCSTRLLRLPALHEAESFMQCLQGKVLNVSFRGGTCYLGLILYVCIYIVSQAVCIHRSAWTVITAQSSRRPVRGHRRSI